MHNIIEMVLTVIIIILFILYLIAIRGRFNRTMLIVSLVTFILLLYLVRFLPVDYPFVTFNSPTKAFYYTNHEVSIIDIIETDDCAYIIYDKNSKSSDNDIGVYVSTILKRGDEWGYVLPWSDWGSKRILIHRGEIEMHRFSHCQSTLVLIFQLAKLQPIEYLDPWDIQDEYNSEFSMFEINKDDGTLVRYYYSVIETESSNYEIDIDGQTIDIDRQVG